MPIDPLDETQAESVAEGTLTAGGTIGGYELRDVLGQGGMGVVWSAHDASLDRTIAIKVLRRADASPELRTRLLREARAMAKLKHPNVLTVYEVGSDAGRDFIAMELVDGGSLDGWLASAPAREEILEALLAAGKGLAAAHAAGLVHRDFKPHNVLRSKDGARILVTDFGLARGVGEEGVAVSATSADDVLHSTLTQSGMLLGTPAYMAPEQWAGKSPDPRTDQFAFCVTAWQALTGTRPFDGTTLDELRRQVQAGVADREVDLPGDVRAILVRGLDPDPDRRWPDLDALLAALSRATHPRPGPRRRRWPLLALGASAVAAAGVIAAVSLRGHPGAAQACHPGAMPAWSSQLPAAAAALDHERTRWLGEYDAACKADDRQQLACLSSARLRITAYATQLAKLDQETAGALDPFEDLVAVRGCTPLPADGIERDRVMRLWRAMFELRAASGDRLPAAIAEVHAAATSAARSWAPAQSFAALALAARELRAGAISDARARLQHALPVAGEPQLTAAIQLALLEASLAELADPGDHPDARPTALEAPPLHRELQGRLDAARRAVDAAGSPPELTGELARLDALAQYGLAQRTFYPAPARRAVQRAQDARAAFEQAGDVTHAADAGGAEARYDLGRGQVDEAIAAVRSATAAMDHAKLAYPPTLELARRELAAVRGQTVAPDAPVAEATGSLHTGRVVGPDGKPPATPARVIAWTGELHGDAVNLDREHRHADVEAKDDGSFEIRAESGAAIVAQTAELRSAPQPIGSGRITLALQPTRVHAGSVDAYNIFGVDAFARYTIGSASWYVHAPIDHDRTFHISGLPSGSFRTGTIGPAGDAHRRVVAPEPRATTLPWASGPDLEVIVRSPASDASVFVFRGRVAPKTHAALVTLATSASDVATAPLHAIGFDATFPGRSLYVGGDRHAVITGCAPGDTTVCVATTTQVHCATTVLPAATVHESGAIVATDTVPLVIDP